MAKATGRQATAPLSDMKFSRQRTAILENVAGRKDHPTADMVYASLRKDYPRISLGTVYRNLSLLTQLHMIRRLHCGDGTEHYDGDISDHDHFICTRCGRIIDLFRDETEGMPEAFPVNGEIAHIDYRALIYYGTCGSCAGDGAVNNA